MLSTVFKIRDRDTGLYSTGGQEPQWDAKGKTWKNIGHVKNHLRQYVYAHDYGPHRRLRAIPVSWEVVAFEVVTTERSAVSAGALYCPKLIPTTGVQP